MHTVGASKREVLLGVAPTVVEGSIGIPLSEGTVTLRLQQQLQSRFLCCFSAFPLKLLNNLFFVLCKILCHKVSTHL